MSRTIKFGTFISTHWKFSFKLFAIFSTLSSNTGFKSLRILFLYIFLSLTVPFVYVSFTATFFRFFILLFPQFISILLIFQFICYFPHFFLLLTFNICHFLISLLPFITLYHSVIFSIIKIFPWQFHIFPVDYLKIDIFLLVFSIHSVI